MKALESNPINVLNSNLIGLSIVIQSSTLSSDSPLKSNHKLTIVNSKISELNYTVQTFDLSVASCQTIFNFKRQDLLFNEVLWYYKMLSSCFSETLVHLRMTTFDNIHHQILIPLRYFLFHTLELWVNFDYYTSHSVVISLYSCMLLNL